MIDWIKEPWPWYVSGPLIGLSIPFLLIVGNKMLGISSSLRHTCAAILPAGIPFLKYNWKAETWNLIFALGILIGGFVGGNLLNNGEPIKISEKAKTDIQKLGINNFEGLVPEELFNWETVFSLKGLLILVLGGFLIGFGSRYAGGCTSGHAIMGLSSLQWPSLIAVIFFFIGGLLMTHFIAPLIYSLF
ncbi:MAG: YeeE/YedE family protein [Bacteroidetes bacterium]|nr:YeeE/YedE family protein [Bacteroidota bacterium]